MDNECSLFYQMGEDSLTSLETEKRMDHTQELTKALAELKRITGISMEVTADTPEEAEQAVTQIR